MNIGIDTLVALFCIGPQVQTIAALLSVSLSTDIGMSNIASILQVGCAAIKRASIVMAEKGSQAAARQV